MGNGGGGAKISHYIMCHHFAGTGINALGKAGDASISTPKL